MWQTLFWQMNVDENITFTPARSRLILALALCALCAYGLFFIYSTGYIGDAYPVRENWQRQGFFFAIGAVVFWFISKLDYRTKTYKSILWVCYAIGIALLAMVLLVGKETGGAKRWISFGFIQLQPAEMAKVFTILLVARVLADTQRSFPAFVLTALLTLIPFFLILIEPSYGNAFSIIPSIIAMAAFRWCPQKTFAFPCLIFIALALSFVCGTAWLRSEQGIKYTNSVLAENNNSHLLKNYHINRIKNFLDPKGAWNERQAILTIASGGPSGKGFLQGTMKGYGFLPRTVAPTDFIFSVIGEELGFFFGCLPVLCLYATIIFIGLKWAANAKDNLGTMTCIAVTMLIFTHVAVNIGMTVRMIPIIGLPLPLLSYGGSYALATLAALGAMTSVPTAENSPAGKTPDNLTWSIGKILKIYIQNTNR